VVSRENRKLTIKQKEVAAALIADPDFNVARAYKSVYTTCSDRSAQSASSRLMLSPLFQRHLSELMKQRNDLQEQEGADESITQERVLKELGKIAFSNIKTVADWTAKGVAFKPSESLDLDASVIIQEVSSSYSIEGVQTLKLKLHDKMRALQLLAKHTGLLLPMQEAILALRRYGIFIRPRPDGGYELIDAYDTAPGEDALDFISGLGEESEQS
jgi:phage terminase small subunit